MGNIYPTPQLIKEITLNLLKCIIFKNLIVHHEEAFGKYWNTIAADNNTATIVFHFL